jgi:hypothetical protein
MNRSPELKQLTDEMIRESIMSSQNEMREAIEKAILDASIVNPVTGPWLEEQVLTLNDPERLWFVAERLKAFPVSPEFHHKLFERIDPMQSAETNLVFIGCLLDHADPKSEFAAKLRALQKAMESQYVSEMGRQVEEDLRWMIQQAEIVKRQSERQSIEQLELLLKLADE